MTAKGWLRKTAGVEHIGYSRKLIYVAHPVAGDAEGNAVKTINWVRFLAESDVGYGRHYFAPWVAHVLAFAGYSKGEDWYDEVIEADCEMVRACDGIILLGGRVSPGMYRERQTALDSGIPVLDCSQWTSPLDVPPAFHRVEGWSQLWEGL